jgi:hypothetical protein
MLKTENNGPSLANVLAFTMLESLDDVARVHSAAALRLTRSNPWRVYRVLTVDIAEEPDDLVRIKVSSECISDVHSESRVREFEFLVGANNSKRSQRFDAFCNACGVKDRLDDTRELEGRNFSVRNRGRSPMDFGTVTDFLFPGYVVAA